MNRVFIRLKDKSNNCISDKVSLKDLIYNQDEIEFRFPNYVDDIYNETYEAQIPYNDFLFFMDDYEVIVEIKGDKKNETKRCN